MSTDAESLVKGTSDTSGTADVPDDLGSTAMKLVEKMNLKMAGFVLLLFIFVNTTFVVNGIGRLWPAAQTTSYPTEYGIFIQALLTALGFIILNVLCEAGLI